MIGNRRQRGIFQLMTNEICHGFIAPKYRPVFRKSLPFLPIGNGKTLQISKIRNLLLRIHRLSHFSFHRPLRFNDDAACLIVLSLLPWKPDPGSRKESIIVMDRQCLVRYTMLDKLIQSMKIIEIRRCSFFHGRFPFRIFPQIMPFFPADFLHGIRAGLQKGP